MIIVNLKNYELLPGLELLEMVKTCEKVSLETGVKIGVAVSAFDLAAAVSVALSGGVVEVWSQHLDGVSLGATTGWLCPEVAKSRGAEGTLLNHSEHKLLNDELRRSVERCKVVGLKTCICADSPDEAMRVAELAPNFVAYEPTELIGNQDKSVAGEKPELISQIVRTISLPLLIGAGIHSGKDVEIGLSLGCVGILVSSDVVLAVSAEKELRELALGFSGRE